MKNINKEMFKILTNFQGIKGMGIPDTFLQGQVAEHFSRWLEKEI